MDVPESETSSEKAAEVLYHAHQRHDLFWGRGSQPRDEETAATTTTTTTTHDSPSRRDESEPHGRPAELLHDEVRRHLAQAVGDEEAREGGLLEETESAMLADADSSPSPEKQGPTHIVVLRGHAELGFEALDAGVAARGSRRRGRGSKRSVRVVDAAKHTVEDARKLCYRNSPDVAAVHEREEVENSEDGHEAQVDLAICAEEARSASRPALVLQLRGKGDAHSLSSSALVKMRAGTLTAPGCSAAWPKVDDDSTCSV